MCIRDRWPHRMGPINEPTTTKRCVRDQSQANERAMRMSKWDCSWCRHQACMHTVHCTRPNYLQQPHNFMSSAIWPGSRCLITEPDVHNGLDNSLYAACSTVISSPGEVYQLLRWVCLFLSLCSLAYLGNQPVELHQIFVHVACGRGSVLLWLRCGMLLLLLCVIF